MYAFAQVRPQVHQELEPWRAPTLPHLHFIPFTHSLWQQHANDAMLLGMHPTLWLVADGREQVGIGGQGCLADALRGAQDGI